MNSTLNQQVQTLFEQGKYQEAIPLAEKAVEIAKRVHGLENPNTATSLNNLAAVIQKTWASTPKPNRSSRSAPDLPKVLGSEHPDTALNVPTQPGRSGHGTRLNTPRPRPLYLEEIRIRRKVSGSNRP